MVDGEVHRTVVIVGAGVAGLAVGTMLRRNGIDCIILERRRREHVEARQRAGTLDARGVRLFREWGLAEVLDAVPAPEIRGGFYMPPMSAKGIHLALFAAETFARAMIAQVRDDDPRLLDAYSDTCLRHVWNYQAFATWITDLMHDTGDPSYRGEFRKQQARAELRRQFESEASNRVFSEFTAGIA
ncbi:FAD-dependent monooxygenase [Actinoplanes sp. NPDC051494]|uniref:FAD-dependent monooxygenase n=1 Tax=Actinoplanes sp. NPDC051494 TaxID=3363907 RepID=UPI0037AF7DEB